MNIILVFVSLIFAKGVAAQSTARNISSSIEKGVNTECKTCPYSLCTNKAAYDGSTGVTLLCWTRGTVIDGDRLLKFHYLHTL